MTLNQYAAILIAATISITAASCKQSGKAAVTADTLVTIGNSTLTQKELNANVPSGMQYDDSVRYANAYIKAWIDARLASNIAARELDMTDIDRMVDQYRNELIMQQYGAQLYTQQAPEIPEDTIKAYYDTHKDELKLSRPMVKGVYLKVADDSKSIKQLRKLYRSQKPGDIDNLDKSELNGAVHYDYFRDSWIDWEQIESRIPYDFGTSPDAFLRSHDHIDTSSGGFTYLLDINDVLYTGQTMPYDAAKPMIAEKLRYADRRKFDAKLKKDLYDKAVKDGTLQIFCDLQ